MRNGTQNSNISHPRQTPSSDHSADIDPMGGVFGFCTSLFLNPSNNKIEKFRVFLDTESGNDLFEELQFVVETLHTKDIAAEKMLQIYNAFVKIMWPDKP